VCLLALLCWVIALSVQLRSLQNSSNSSIAPECVHALGGGPVAAGGSLHPATPEHCKAQLRAYAQGAYWREVELAAADATQTFGFAAPAAPGSSSSTGSSKGGLISQLVQQVSRSLLAFAGGSADTTTRSSSSSSSSGNKGTRSSGRLGGPMHCGVAVDQPAQRAGAGETVTPATVRLARSQAQQGQARPLVVFDIDETLLSNMPQILDPEAWPWEAWVAAARAEPLQPMVAFYAALCR
jgi:hypothetical protein